MYFKKHYNVFITSVYIISVTLVSYVAVTPVISQALTYSLSNINFVCVYIILCVNVYVKIKNHSKHALHAPSIMAAIMFFELKYFIFGWYRIKHCTYLQLQ